MVINLTTEELFEVIKTQRDLLIKMAENTPKSRVKTLK